MSNPNNNHNNNGNDDSDDDDDSDIAFAGVDFAGVDFDDDNDQAQGDQPSSWCLDLEERILFGQELSDGNSPDDDAATRLAQFIQKGQYVQAMAVLPERLREALSTSPSTSTTQQLVHAVRAVSADSTT